MSGWTLADAQAYVTDRLDEGVECPCCGQNARLYKRKLNSAMARSLIWLVQRQVGFNFVNVPAEAPQWLLRARELPKLVHWGLVESEVNVDPAKRTSGRWRATEPGIEFAHGFRAMWSHVHLYNNTVWGFSDTPITVREALGSKFDYEELMNGIDP